MINLTTQKSYILGALLNGKKITPLDALYNYGCFRLGARVNELRNEGYNIHTKLIQDGKKRYAEYRLLK